MGDTTQLHEHLQLGNACRLCLAGWSGSGLFDLDLFGQLGHFAVLTQRGGAGREGTGFLCPWGRFCFGRSMVPPCPKQCCLVWAPGAPLAPSARGALTWLWAAATVSAGEGKRWLPGVMDSTRHRVRVFFKIKLLTAMEVISFSSLSPHRNLPLSLKACAEGRGLPRLHFIPAIRRNRSTASRAVKNPTLNQC